MKLKQIAERLNKLIKARFSEQGHHLSGAWEASMRTEATETNANVYANDYTGYVDRGVNAANIPFSPGSGAKHSKYIEALTRYVKARNMTNDDKEALNIAFAIAHKHKKEGMPTGASRRFSKNGKRTDFLSDVLEEQKDETRRLIMMDYATTLQVKINNQIRKQSL